LAIIAAIPRASSLLNNLVVDCNPAKTHRVHEQGTNKKNKKRGEGFAASRWEARHMNSNKWSGDSMPRVVCWLFHKTHWVLAGRAGSGARVTRIAGAAVNATGVGLTICGREKRRNPY
jgi:hypothetical protein